MAGFLSWAADVVGGGSNGNGEEEEEEQRQRMMIRMRVVPKFSKEEAEYVRDLDRKASSLQRSLQQLRQRLDPPKHSLPHLHAEFLASNSALVLEQQAHNATRQQAQTREATLQEENASYVKAIAAGKEEIAEKSKEALKLTARLKEMDDAIMKLQNEYEDLQASHVERDGKESFDESLSSLQATKAIDVEKKRNELKMWEHRLSTLEEKWRTLQNSLANQPSPAQREKELERRLRGLTEQLMLKQVQLDNLSREKKAVESKLNEMTLLNTHHNDAAKSFRRNRTVRSWTRRDVTSDEPEESKIHSSSLNNLRVWGQKLSLLADSIGLEGRLKFMVLRSLIAAYILALHLVFIIFAFVKISRWH